MVHTISLRVARFLERRGFLERDYEDSYLTLDCLDDGPMQQLHGHAITYRIALGPQQGRKVFTLQTIPPSKATSSVSTRVAKLAALIPKPRVNLTRFHGVFAPNSKWREQVTPAKRGKTKKLPEKEGSEKSPAEHHIVMNCTRGHKGTATKAGIHRFVAPDKT